MTDLKTELEELSINEEASLSIMVNPNLSDFFYWHFHPEYELVFIEGADGTRHVGDHISQFKGSDLVLIGSNIPHLNFDYGIKTPYEKIVVHLKPDFQSRSLYAIPELTAINHLFEKSMHAVAFGQQSKQLIGQRLKTLPNLAPFNQLLELLSILQVLAKADDQELLHEHSVKNQYTSRDKERLKAIYAFVDRNYQRKIEIREIADLSNLTNEAFCRYFKKMTRLTFTEFVNHYRIDKAKKLLLTDQNITETCFKCGFESVSYFNRVFKRVTKENPLAFKKRYHY